MAVTGVTDSDYFHFQHYAWTFHFTVLGN
jgi:hypothetical protein